MPKKKDEGTWIDALPKLPDLPKGKRRQAIIIPKRKQKERPKTSE
jgi:hypothetical protein